MPAASSATALSRELWPQTSIYHNIFQQSPGLALIKKDENFADAIRHIYVGYAAPQGVAANFPDAKQYKTAAKQVRFDIQTRSYYAAFSVNGDVWRKYKYTGNKGLVLDEVARNSKLLMQQVKNDLSSFLHGNGVANLGRMTSGSTPTSSATITLATGSDARRIEPGMALQTESTGATGGTIRTGYVTVNSIGGTDTAPTITVDQTNWATGIPAVAASDYIYRAGTYDQAFYGFDAWNPNHGGTPGTFLGANRNLYAAKLAGQLLDGTKMGNKQRMIRAARMVQDTGFTPDTYLLSTRQWENLYNELASQGQLRMTKVPAAPIGKMNFGVSFDAIEFVGPGGRLEVLADPWMPDSVERCFDRSVYTLASVGPLVHWDDGAEPGKPMLEDAQDAREIRMVGDIAMYCEAPWAAVRVAVTP